MTDSKSLSSPFLLRGFDPDWSALDEPPLPPLLEFSSMMPFYKRKFSMFQSKIFLSLPPLAIIGVVGLQARA